MSWPPAPLTPLTVRRHSTSLWRWSHWTRHIRARLDRRAAAAVASFPATCGGLSAPRRTVRVRRAVVGCVAAVLSDVASVAAGCCHPSWRLTVAAPSAAVQSSWGWSPARHCWASMRQGAGSACQRRLITSGWRPSRMTAYCTGVTGPRRPRCVGPGGRPWM
jgi:hypothetical protein